MKTEPRLRLNMLMYLLKNTCKITLRTEPMLSLTHTRFSGYLVTGISEGCKRMTYATHPIATVSKQEYTIIPQ